VGQKRCVLINTHWAGDEIWRQGDSIVVRDEIRWSRRKWVGWSDGQSGSQKRGRRGDVEVDIDIGIDIDKSVHDCSR
jgi:hypothetical protein